MIALPIVLAAVRCYFCDWAGFSKRIFRNDTIRLNRKVNEAFKIQYLIDECIDMIFEQGNPAD
jgi:4-hydroxy-tetrahydrodipicolinate synthase